MSSCGSSGGIVTTVPPSANRSAPANRFRTAPSTTTAMQPCGCACQLSRRSGANDTSFTAKRPVSIARTPLVPCATSMRLHVRSRRTLGGDRAGACPYDHAMERERARELCASYAGAEETYPFGERTAVYKVGGKMFALVPLDAD